MDPDNFRNTALIVLVCAMLFHLLPTLYLSFNKRRGQGRSVWVTYLIWFAILPVLFGPLLGGRLAFLLFSLAASCLSIMEFSRHTELHSDAASERMMIVLVAILYIAVFWGDPQLFMAFYFLSLMVILVFHLLRQEPEKWHSKLLVSIYIYSYCGVFLAFLPLAYELEQGKEFLFLYLFLIINNDAFGYIIGSRLGRHKFISKVSPNKSLEGIVAGMLATIMIGIALKPYFVPVLSTLEIVLFCLLLSVGGTAGDLVMSLSKRAFKLKDFGSVIPAHGGILDRLDSSILMAPALFFYVAYR